MQFGSKIIVWKHKVGSTEQQLYERVIVIL